MTAPDRLTPAPASAATLPPLDLPDSHEQFTEKHLRSLVSSTLSTTASTGLEQVERQFAATDSHYIAVLESNRPVGLVSRDQVAQWLQPHRPELAGRPIAELCPLIPPGTVRTDMSLREVLNLAAAHGTTLLQNDLILTDEKGEFVGLIAAHIIQRVQQHFLNRAFDQLALQGRALAEQREQSQHERELAQVVQAAMLPRRTRFDIDHRRPGGESLHLRIRSRHLSAPQFGGDFFHFFVLPDDCIGLFVGDAMGHGATSALVVALLRTRVEAAQARAATPGAFLTELNQQLIATCSPSGLISATGLYLHLDIPNGRGTIANAGHPHPLLLSTEDQPEPDWPGGTPLGMFADTDYPEMAFRFGPDSDLLLYTDGLYKLHNPHGDALGETRLRALAATTLRAHPRGGIRRLLGALDRFRGTAPYVDDACLIRIHSEVRHSSERKEFPLDLKGVGQGRRFVINHLNELGSDAATRHAFALAVTELATNLVEHGNPPAGARFALEVESSSAQIRMDIAAPQASFRDRDDLLAHAGNLDTLDVCAESGRGLALVRNAFPDLDYTPRGQRDDHEHYMLQRLITPAT